MRLASMRFAPHFLPLTGTALFIIAGATLILLFIGIHNAWDAVTYHLFTKRANITNQKS